MDRITDRWMDGYNFRRVNGWIELRTGALKHRWMDGWLAGWLNGWNDGWMDKRMGRQMNGRLSCWLYLAELDGYGGYIR